MAHAALSASGYENLLVAESATQALEVSAKHPKPIHLLLSDITMPGQLNGRDLARKISEERPETKVVLMSGEVKPVECIRQVWRFIPKPFLVSTLIQTVKEVLNEPPEYG
jgi:DNA-binding NtrC family response regulator